MRKAEKYCRLEFWWTQYWSDWSHKLIWLARQTETGKCTNLTQKFLKKTLFLLLGSSEINLEALIQFLLSLCQQSSKKKKIGVHRSFMPLLLVIIWRGVFMRCSSMRSWPGVKRWVKEWRHSSVSKGGVRTTSHTGIWITKDVDNYLVGHTRSWLLWRSWWRCNKGVILLSKVSTKLRVKPHLSIISIGSKWVRWIKVLVACIYLLQWSGGCSHIPQNLEGKESC
jgi:hypothetical protein